VPGRWSGDDLARVGKILGIVATVVCALIALFFVSFVSVGLGVFAFSVGSIG
jgi:hypothetical protein